MMFGRGNYRLHGGFLFFVEAQIEGKWHTVLMDTSGSFHALFENASKLGVGLSAFEDVFISHWHSDHCGSPDHVLPMLRRSTPVYVPSLSLYGFSCLASTRGCRASESLRRRGSQQQPCQ
jgi:metal-dependent hydrolase (beta-lactamase superfamily II)